MDALASPPSIRVGGGDGFLALAVKLVVGLGPKAASMKARPVWPSEEPNARGEDRWEELRS